MPRLRATATPSGGPLHRTIPSLLMVPLIVACHGGGTADPTDTGEAQDDDCGQCSEAHRIELDHSDWQTGEYHFEIDIPEHGERYTCVSVLPAGVYMGEEHCPADVIGTQLRLTGSSMEPTALLLYRADFERAYLSIAYVGADAASKQLLVNRTELNPAWSTEDPCECTTSAPSSVEF